MDWKEALSARHDKKRASPETREVWNGIAKLEGKTHCEEHSAKNS
jgi:hypothetical protein